MGEITKIDIESMFKNLSWDTEHIEWQSNALRQLASPQKQQEHWLKLSRSTFSELWKLLEAWKIWQIFTQENQVNLSKNSKVCGIKLLQIPSFFPQLYNNLESQPSHNYNRFVL